MIKIINYQDLKDDFFNGRDFGSSIDIVKDILLNVKTNGDKALLEYGTKFDVSAPSSLEIPQSELKAAAQKMQKENPELYKSLCYSHDLALRFAKKQRESFDNFEVELEPGLFSGLYRLLPALARRIRLLWNSGHRMSTGAGSLSWEQRMLCSRVSFSHQLQRFFCSKLLCQCFDPPNGNCAVPP